MNKTKIEWCDFTWNPIKGLCPVGCWYCYGRKLYLRFGETIMGNYEDEEGGSDWNIKRPFFADPGQEKCPKRPSRIFVCSTFELFHPVADKWRDDIFLFIEAHHEHTFIILTKMPVRIDRPMPDNVWLGVSVTGESMFEIYRAGALGRTEARVRFISFEPILGKPWVISYMSLRANWIIAGRLTGHGKIHDPARSTIEAIVEYGKANDIPVFLKDNLLEIWGAPLIQELP